MSVIPANKRVDKKRIIGRRRAEEKEKEPPSPPKKCYCKQNVKNAMYYL
jgi:hypothetical protein